METSILEKAGLTPGEAKVYISLLELGQSSITPIITKSGVSTSKSYDILNRLEEKGLVSHIILSGVKHFKAANPNRIIENLESKEEEIKQNLISIKNIIPTLIEKQREKEGNEEAEIYVGIKGLNSVFKEETEWMKKSKEPSYAIGLTSGGKAGKKISEYFKRMQYQRDKLKLKTYIVANKNSKGSFPYLEKSKFCFIRYLDSGSEMTSINVYDNKTLIAVYSAKPFLFVIKSEDLANDFRNYIKSMWKIAKP